MSGVHQFAPAQRRYVKFRKDVAQERFRLAVSRATGGCVQDSGTQAARPTILAATKPRVGLAEVSQTVCGLFPPAHPKRQANGGGGCRPLCPHESCQVLCGRWIIFSARMRDGVPCAVSVG